ncbi:sensory neuron membrane protein 2-like isoform X2 [Rhodnius prolixus]
MAHLCVHKVSLASGVGTVIVILGIVLGWYGFPYVFNKNVAQRISLFPGSEAMQRWMEIPFPLEFKVYFFNVTNADRIQEGERPELQEVGPYVFDLYKTKVNVSYNKVNDTLDYYTQNKYFFNHKKSFPRKEKDILVLVNVPLMATATMVERLFPVGLSFLDKAVPYLFPNITNMFITASAKEFMFDGVLVNCSYAVGPAMPVCNGMRGKLPQTVVPVPDSKDFKFSFFKHKNETLEGPFKIFGGNKDIFKMGQIIEYKSSNNLIMWESNSTCSQLKGTDSTVFPPISDLNNDIFIYIPDICLSLAAIYKNKTIINDMTMYRYESSDKNFADENSVPENQCRCRQNEEGSGPPVCLKQGAIDASNCQGAPVIFTQPHFLDADPEYTQYPEGLSPDREKHLTFVILEPKTGVPVIGRKRMQMNIFLRKIEDITLLTNISEGLLPIAWVEEGGELNEESLEKLEDMYYILHSLDVIKWIIISIGILVLFAAMILYAKYRGFFCFNGNQVSEFSYGVNTFHVEGKMNHDRTKSSVFGLPTTNRNGGLESGDDIQTISSNIIHPDGKLNENLSNSVLPS